ncbi:MAG TPA: hypothetical protein VEQ40_06395, partial [Pyrinomonadaceae bacterium]|nr:hypothetical protein [Pyrinomonadaceae bacterium]
MLLRRTSLLSFVWVLLLAAAQVCGAQQRNTRAPATGAAAPEISYTVSMPEPHTHLLHVEMRVRGAGAANLPAQVDLVMPVWTPGSYLVREYARHVQDFAASDAG